MEKFNQTNKYENRTFNKWREKETDKNKIHFIS